MIVIMFILKNTVLVFIVINAEHPHCLSFLLYILNDVLVPHV